MKKAVISLGHKSLGFTINEQWDAVKTTAKVLADLSEEGFQLTITHSNGPQISMIHKAMSELHRLSPSYSTVPMCVCSAMSQGYVGYDIQNSLRAEFLSRNNATPVSTILTQVTVDPYDEAFYDPQKVIGRYMTREEADFEIAKGNYVTDEEPEGYRRRVASPTPLDIVEIDAIRTLADAGQAVVCCGGGGIPVIEQKHALKGASAVIEKDAIAGKLASSLGSDILLILTGVDCVYTGFETDQMKPIDTMNVAKAEEYIAAGHFGEGNMRPKIEASIEYLRAVPMGRVIITSLDNAINALRGNGGTTIVR